MSIPSKLIINTKFISGAHAIPRNSKLDLHLPFPQMPAKIPRSRVDEAGIRISMVWRANTPSPWRQRVRKSLQPKFSFKLARDIYHKINILIRRTNAPHATSSH